MNKLTTQQRKLFKASVIVAYKSAFKPLYTSWSIETGIKTSILRQMAFSVLSKHITQQTIKCINEKTRSRSKKTLNDPQSLIDFRLDEDKQAMLELADREERAEKADYE